MLIIFITITYKVKKADGILIFRVGVFDIHKFLKLERLISISKIASIQRLLIFLLVRAILRLLLVVGETTNCLLKFILNFHIQF